MAAFVALDRRVAAFLDACEQFEGANSGWLIGYLREGTEFRVCRALCLHSRSSALLLEEPDLVEIESLIPAGLHVIGCFSCLEGEADTVATCAQQLALHKSTPGGMALTAVQGTDGAWQLGVVHASGSSSALAFAEIDCCSELRRSHWVLHCAPALSVTVTPPPDLDARGAPAVRDWFKDTLGGALVARLRSTTTRMLLPSGSVLAVGDGLRLSSLLPPQGEDSAPLPPQPHVQSLFGAVVGVSLAEAADAATVPGSSEESPGLELSAAPGTAVPVTVHLNALAYVPPSAPAEQAAEALGCALEAQAREAARLLGDAATAEGGSAAAALRLTATTLLFQPEERARGGYLERQAALAGTVGTGAGAGAASEARVGAEAARALALGMPPLSVTYALDAAEAELAGRFAPRSRAAARVRSPQPLAGLLGRLDVGSGLPQERSVSRLAMQRGALHTRLCLPPQPLLLTPCQLLLDPIAADAEVVMAGVARVVWRLRGGSAAGIAGEGAGAGAAEPGEEDEWTGLLTGGKGKVGKGKVGKGKGGKGKSGKGKSKGGKGGKGGKGRGRGGGGGGGGGSDEEGEEEQKDECEGEGDEDAAKAGSIASAAHATLPSAAAAAQRLVMASAGGWLPLLNVHEGIPDPELASARGAMTSKVHGRFAYYHYLQGGEQDKGWGCAYRSLQTLVSWFALNHYASVPVPSLRDVQSVLVAMGDKPGSFVGSANWIGSQEVGFVLDELIGVQSRYIVMNSGAEMGQHARVLAHHFQTVGTPVMIGGGALAFTLLGVCFHPSTGEARYLILDPHYTGPDDLDLVQAKVVAMEGYRAVPCSWRDGSAFKATSFYNVCMPLAGEGGGGLEL